jgi:light-regulated signal transduction histidine kinase (bacteriophytochrome)
LILVVTFWPTLSILGNAPSPNGDAQFQPVLNSLLNPRSDGLDQTKLWWNQVIFPFYWLVGIAVPAIGLLVFRNGIRRREVSENALRQKNEDLEKRVAELAAKESELELRTKDLARSNADLEQFAYAASHDLQEPLRAMSGCAEVLKRKYQGKLDPKADELVGMIVDGSARMKGLIEGLLTYSRAGQDQNLETIDTGAVLQKVLVELSVALRECKAEISSANLPSLRFVNGEFERVLLNLIGNALKYRGPDSPKIRVDAERQITSWIFRIMDNGLGFEPEYADKIFGVFQRLNTGAEHRGTGIGLAIVKKIVERRGGWIWVDSVPGQGSTFYFSVPDEYNERETSPESRPDENMQVLDLSLPRGRSTFGS